MISGRTHQIRVHLAATGHQVLGDELYGQTASRPAAKDAPARKRPVRVDQPPTVDPQLSAPKYSLALRAVRLAYRDPFTKQGVEILAPVDEAPDDVNLKIAKVIRL